MAVPDGPTELGFRIQNQTETGPLFVGPNFVPRYNAVNLHPNFFCHFECVITRPTVRGNESFMSNPFLRAHFDMTDGSKNVFLRANRLLTRREIMSDVQWLDLRTP